MKKIGYLGPPGTFSELAARRYLELIAGPGSETDLQVEMISFPSLLNILSSVEQGELDEGIIPLENSTEGAVNQALDLLAFRFHGIQIKGEVILPVVHQLLARPGIKLSEIKRVISHSQALAQCREFIERVLPKAEIVEAASTAEAARIVAETQTPWGAIGTSLAAKSTGLVILVENINDYPNNATRFVIVGQHDSLPAPGCKTSIVFSITDRPGALYNILYEFAYRNINLTRIESRPAKSRLGDYLFFIDFEGHRQDPLVQEALDTVSARTVTLRVLGSYPADMRWQKDSPPPGQPTLEELRKEIDLVDNQIVELLGKRTRLVEKVGKLKPSSEQVRDIVREEKIIQRLKNLARKEGVDEKVVENVYHLLLDHFVWLQKAKKKTGY